MLKGHNRNTHVATPSTGMQSAAMRATGPHRAPLARPEPDYEVVEFPSDQYVNAKLQPPPPPPPRPITGPLSEAAAVSACGLCGGGGARVRCAECGPRALCASCDEMYHRHPKRRNHRRQTLPLTQTIRIERPPLPPKTAPPVPPPRRHKISGERLSASPHPPATSQRQLGSQSPISRSHVQNASNQQIPPHLASLQHSMQPAAPLAHLNNVPFMPTSLHHTPVPQHLQQSNPVGHMSATWGRPRGSLTGYNMNNMGMPVEPWDTQENFTPSMQSWGRPMRRGASVLELSGGGVGGVGCACAGCGPPAPPAWRYGSCASLDHAWLGGPGAWPPPPCCATPHNMHMHSHQHAPTPRTPQPIRRAESRTGSRGTGGGGATLSRAASPALSTRSRASRRTRRRTPSPPPLPSSSDADSECGDSDPPPADDRASGDSETLGPPPPPPDAPWHCEHCTFLNEAGVHVCAICCRTPTTAPIVAAIQIQRDMTKLKLSTTRSPSIEKTSFSKKSKQNGEGVKQRPIKEKTSTGCGPSPPKETKKTKSSSRLSTPAREPEVENRGSTHDMAVGASPPKDIQNTRPASRKSSPYRETARPVAEAKPARHNVSVGPSPPKEYNTGNVQKKSTGTSPPRDAVKGRASSTTRSVSNSGTSPPPQNISTQTYEVPRRWDGVAGEDVRGDVTGTGERRARGRAGRAGRPRRDRSHSAHSASSDTRESERSARTSIGGGMRDERWEWRSRRDSSPGPAGGGVRGPGGEWSGSERLARRRASHLDLRRARSTRRTQHYASEATSPEPFSSSRAVSLEALAGLEGRRETERGLELAQLMVSAERSGFSAAEVHAALAQCPGAPLAWLRERWGGLCAGVRAAAARLAPLHAPPSDREVRQALAKHRGAMWPAVTDCVERCRRKAETGGEAMVRGRTGEAGSRAGDSSDEFELPIRSESEDDWMYLPLDAKENSYRSENFPEQWNEAAQSNTDNIDVASKLKALLIQAGIPTIDEKLLLKGLLKENYTSQDKIPVSHNTVQNILPSVDLGQSESDFIDAYNALTRLSPLPNVNITNKKKIVNKEKANISSMNPTKKERTLERKKVTNSPTSSNNNKRISETAKALNNNKQEEKPSNLSEIVDNTHKLIQQMKEEITSDINSIDSMSQRSEMEDSSNDSEGSEHESSYSESEEKTEDLSSDEKESSNENNDNIKTNKINSIVNRTSSEDNEQFEEAIDQFVDFQQKNIEMLDSIARNLQEEHVIAVEVTQTQANNVFKPNNINNDYNNNNDFATVNTFEEIYQELNSHDKGKNLNIISENVKNNSLITNNNEPVLNLPQKKVVTYEKQEIQMSNFKPESPKKVIVTNCLYSTFTALIESTKDLLTIDNTNNNKIEYIDNDTTIENENEFEVENRNEIVIDLKDLQIHNDSTFETQNDTDNTLEESPNTIHQNDEKSEEIPFTNGLNKEVTIVLNEKKSSNNITNNKTISIKSNIPKLIRDVQTNKQKNLKPVKLITSKVPIRRASIKQYHAPAPPKPKFGNVQSGHVKQLQSQIFNAPPKPSSSTPPKSDEVKSTLITNKKKLAPLPPTDSKEKIQQSSSSEPQILKNDHKKPYFTETCRTEDEWTDSDSEDSQMFTPKPPEEEKLTPPSPPPPLTLRRVSGQLIDLAKVRLPEGSPERQARMLLAEGATESWEQARLAVELVRGGAAPAGALLAALECADRAAALAYLHQDCELCASKFPEYEMVTMLRCTHRCCRECARLYFTVQITERSISDCVCPYCKEPELENLSEDAWLEYFAHLDIQLKTLLAADVHELFQRKLRDRTLARDPNFRWCVECSSGFFVHPKQKKLRCPECKSVSCATCRKPWSTNHEGLTCEQYAAWVEDNDPERAAAAVQQHLRDHGLECPRCRFKYSLSRGGCMHFTCTQCKYEFCNGCGKPFMMGARCGLSEYCARLGLHAHHPRNCLFYLRDKEPHDLQTLLQMNNVSYETEPAEGGNGRCPVQLQRETPTGLVDGLCGAEVLPHHAGLCKVHYVEALAERARSLDPLPVMSLPELVAELRRRGLPLPERGPWDTDPLYAGMCAEIVKEKIPLD